MNPVNLPLLAKKKTDLIWPEHGYFGSAACSIQLEKGICQRIIYFT